MEDEITTMSVRQSTKERLEKIKVHPNQSFDEVINKLLNGEIEHKI